MIDWPKVQSRLGVKPDGVAGRVTYGALLSYIAGRSVPLANDLGFALSLNAHPYGVDLSDDRLGAFLGQCCHESGGFTFLREIWGPTDAQKSYDGRMGNGPGEGFKYRGRGLIQLTGKDNYRDFGSRLGLDLVGHPEIAEQPSGAVLTALEFWKLRGLNELADKEDWTGITRRINGGVNGLQSRLIYINKARGVLS